MKTEWSQILDDVKQQKNIVEGQIRQLNEQKSLLNELFQRQIDNLTTNVALITNLCHIQPNEQEKQPLTNGYEKRVEQLNTIKKIEIPRTETWIRQFNELLQRLSFETENSANKPEQEISSTFDVVPIVDDDSTIDDDSQADEKSIDSPFEDRSSELERKPSVQSNWSSDVVFTCACPMTDASAFGLAAEHSIPGVPCKALDGDKLWTSNRCFHHLLTYHHLKPKVARMIMEYLSSPENRSRDPKSIDLFSRWPTKEVISQSIGLYVRLCPLTVEKIYGLKSGDHFAMCQPRTPVHLEQHFRTVHHFKSECCKRFIKALIDGEPFTQPIFRANENVIDLSLRTKSRRKRKVMRKTRHSR